MCHYQKIPEIENVLKLALFSFQHWRPWRKNFFCNTVFPSTLFCLPSTVQCNEIQNDSEKGM